MLNKIPEVLLDLNGYYRNYGYRRTQFSASKTEIILYVAVIICAILSLVFSAMVKSTFDKYKSYISASGLSGAEAAQRMLQYAGAFDITITTTSGTLSDHYDPRNKTLYLSNEVYYGRSVSSIAVAAHESGHALQDRENYQPMLIRSKLVPVASIGSSLGWIIAIIGLIFAGSGSLLICDIGIALFAMAVLFHVVTLPVEFDASRRALNLTESFGIFTREEKAAGRKVLTVAALTYVAAAASSVISLLRLIVLRNNSRR